MEQLVLGITGGVGSGKSTVLDYLKEECGALVIQADLTARELMEPGGSCYAVVTAEFGDDILQSDGTIDRAALAGIIFRDESKRIRLNELTHPCVKEEVVRRIQNSDAKLVVYESAIPREAFMKEICGEIWFVRVPEEIRITRLMESRGYSRQKCLDIMESQMSEAEFIAYCDRVIENGGSRSETICQVKENLEQMYENRGGSGTILR